MFALPIGAIACLVTMFGWRSQGVASAAIGVGWAVASAKRIGAPAVARSDQLRQVVAIDVVSRQTTTQLANSSFTDMSLSPSGRYVFAADYGGENIGYGTPRDTSYVHRLDLTNMTWDLRTAYIAGNVQAVSDTQLILKSIDQW